MSDLEPSGVVQHENDSKPLTSTLPNGFQLSNAMDPELQLAAPRRRKRFRINPYLLAGLALLVCLWAFYVFPMAQLERAWENWRDPKSSQWRKMVDLASANLPLQIYLRSFQFLTICWFFYFGACIGSFFNVVAGRWPQGRGIVFGGSKCPFCCNGLKFIHNTPIIGWLWCRGKCAFCKLPISPRYLGMEVLIGVMFAGLLLRELVTGGANLPNWRIDEYAGFENLLLSPRWMLVLAYFQHAFLFASLVMIAASSMDHLAFPWRGWLLFVLLIAFVKGVFPDLEFVPWNEGWALEHLGVHADWMPEQWNTWFGPVEVSPVLTLAIGGLVGFVVAWITHWFFSNLVEEHGAKHWCMAGLAIGCVLGWQAVLLIFVVATLLGIPVVAFVRLRSGNTSLALLGTLMAVGYLHHVFWREIVSMI